MHLDVDFSTSASACIAEARPRSAVLPCRLAPFGLTRCTCPKSRWWKCCEAPVRPVLALLDGDHADLAADLAHLQPLCWHVNGSVRGKLAIVEDDMNWLHHRYDHYREEIDGMRQGFVLPRGSILTMQFHLARSSAKKTIRALVRLEEHGVNVPAILGRFCNLLCNLFFVIAGVINQREANTEPPFESKSYGKV